MAQQRPTNIYSVEYHITIPNEDEYNHLGTYRSFNLVIGDRGKEYLLSFDW